MKTLLVTLCLLATICAYHINYHVVIDTVEYKNVPEKYSINKKIALSDGTVEILANVAKNMQKQPAAGTQAIMNDYADKIFGNLKNLMVHEGFDPLELPDQHSGFNYTFIITYHGELDLTSGWLSDMSSIHRGGDVIVSYSSNTKYLLVTVPIAFDDLQFTYDYNAKIMGLGPSGGLAGKIANIGVTVTLGFDTATLTASLDTFQITNSGHIDLNFNGNPLLDWLVNLLTDVATALLKPLILLIVENVIKGGLNAAVDAINDVIAGIINPSTTPLPAYTPAALFMK